MIRRVSRQVNVGNIKIGGECEVGLRLFKEYQGRGYSKKVFKRVSDFLLFELGMKKLNAKCFKQNERSEKMILSSGYSHTKDDETFKYFSRLK